MKKAFLIVTRGGSPQSISAISEDAAWYRAFIGYAQGQSLEEFIATRRHQGWHVVAITYTVQS